jgi:nucleoside-diphosphate-sugar epimerase
MWYSGDLVLITGATGHAGSSTLLHLLRACYHVRVAVRSEAKASVVQGTLNLLEAANRIGTVRRIVITSSIVALVPIEELEGRRRRDRPNPVTSESRTPFVPGPYRSEFAAYAASKVAALHSTETWMGRERPTFGVVHLYPGFVLGRNNAATTPTQAMQGANAVIVLALLLVHALDFSI